CPAAACAIVSLLLIAHDAHERPYRAKSRAASGQRSTTDATVMSGVICRAKGAPLGVNPVLLTGYDGTRRGRSIRAIFSRMASSARPRHLMLVRRSVTSSTVIAYSFEIA